ncbi:MAG: hypothetical protein Q8N37_02345 [bacterium]|nr:hypothetical protein [bacterium]
MYRKIFNRKKNSAEIYFFSAHVSGLFFPLIYIPYIINNPTIGYTEMGIFSTFSTLFNVSENKPRLNSAISLKECFSFIAVPLLPPFVAYNNKHSLLLFRKKARGYRQIKTPAILIAGVFYNEFTPSSCGALFE